MTSKTDVPVPYGFATTAYAYRYFIQATGLEEKMRSLLASLTDVEDNEQLSTVCGQLRAAIMEQEMPQDLQDAIRKAYGELAAKVGEAQPMWPSAPAPPRKTCPMPASPVSRTLT